jgi:hypothetical protein
VVQWLRSTIWPDLRALPVEHVHAGASAWARSTLLRRSRWGRRLTVMGHEERFLPPRLSAGCGFRKETIARTRRNGRDAPLPAIRRNEEPAGPADNAYPSTLL